MSIPFFGEVSRLQPWVGMASRFFLGRVVTNPTIESHIVCNSAGEESELGSLRTAFELHGLTLARLVHEGTH